MQIQEITTISNLYHNILVLVNTPLEWLHSAVWLGAPQAASFFEFETVYEPTLLAAGFTVLIGWSVIQVIKDDIVAHMNAKESAN